MIRIPIVMFIILLACSIPVVVLLITWGILSLIGAINSKREHKHLKKTENELNEKIHIVLTRDKDELDND